MFHRLAPYRKAVIAFVLAVCTWGATAFQDGGVQGAEWWALAAAVLTCAGVYAVPNQEVT